MIVERYRISIEPSGLPAKKMRWAWTVEWLCVGTWKVRGNGYARTLTEAQRKARDKTTLWLGGSMGRYEEYISYEREPASAPSDEPKPLVASRMGCPS